MRTISGFNVVLRLALFFVGVVGTSAFTATTTTATVRGSSSIANRRRGIDFVLSALVVVSPPGGVGEVAAVKAAEKGESVRWFVVSQAGTSQVVISQEALDSIAAGGGSMELAGSDVPSLLLPESESGSAVQAVSSWCGAADSLVCTSDGVESNTKKRKPDEEDPAVAWKNAVKVAAREASKSITGTKIAILSASDTDDMTNGDDTDTNLGIGGLVGNLFGGKIDIPETLTQAMGGTVIKLRHGSIFGTPESSPEFSPLVGGPRRDPVLCEEYSMRSIRVDPTLSISGNLMMGKTTRSSRHAVGEAAALIIVGKVPVQGGLDVCVSSLQGTDPATEEEWEKEFQRVQQVLSSGKAAQLFTTDFSSVPDTERLADWLSEKWAPAVLRTYDIAAIRTGARPVYASRTGDGKVEIIWQELVNFDSVTVGRMVIQVTDLGLTATRGPGDASKGFGSVSSKPLAGEDILVRRLADAASQAIDKGLATKPIAAKKPKAEKAEVEVAVPVTSIQSSGDVAGSTKAPPVTSESGPRQAGARRSTERKRRKTPRKASSNINPKD